MTTMATRLSPVDRLVAWIGERTDREINVVVLYEKGPDELDTTEVEIREAVSAGLRERRLAIGGLASVIQLRDDVEPTQS